MRPVIGRVFRSGQCSLQLSQNKSGRMSDTNHDRRQYEQWVRLYAPELFRFACRLSGRRDIAEDLLQETFTEAWRSILKHREPDQARAWLFQILRFRYAHFLRDNRHHRGTQSLPEELNISPELHRPPLEVLAEQDAMQAALNSLSTAARQTFVMVFVQGLTCRETAAELGIPLGTVLSRLSAAREHLRDRLQQPAAPVKNGGAP